MARYLVKKRGKTFDYVYVPKRFTASRLAKFRREKKWLKGYKLIRAKTWRDAFEKVMKRKVKRVSK